MVVKIVEEYGVRQMNELPDGLTLIQSNEDTGLKLYNATLDFCNKHTIRCKECGTIIMPCRTNTHCNCGRIYNGKLGIVVFDTDRLDPVTL